MAPMPVTSLDLAPYLEIANVSSSFMDRREIWHWEIQMESRTSFSGKAHILFRLLRIVSLLIAFNLLQGASVSETADTS